MLFVDLKDIYILSIVTDFLILFIFKFVWSMSAEQAENNDIDDEKTSKLIHFHVSIFYTTYKLCISMS